MIHHRRASVVLLLFVALFTGCASQTERPPLIIERGVELSGTPFYSQKAYQCGPASLAMLLGASGVVVSPDALVTRVYLPKRRGSLQAELMAASRTYNRIPYRIEPTLASLVNEIEAGRPVLILQNLGLNILPAYHYCVVVGVLENRSFILRSGTRKRVVMDIKTFSRCWEKAGRWGMIALPPGRLPASPDPAHYIKAVNNFERAGNMTSATTAYQAARERWPSNQTVLFALGNNYLHRNRNEEAKEVFKTLLTINPEHIGGGNNLSETLSRLGCVKQASALISETVKIADEMSSPLKAVVLQTQSEIDRKLENSMNGESEKCKSGKRI